MVKTIRKKLYLLLPCAASLVLLFFGCTNIFMESILGAKRQRTAIVPVDSISDVPKEFYIAEDLPSALPKTLTLTATVLPPNATNQKITWTIANDDTRATSPSINEDGSLSADNPGTVKLTATINNGKADGTAFIETFIIEVKQFSEGTGNSSDPFLVYDEDTLKKVGTENTNVGWTLNASYLQIMDIVLTGNWTPIGNESSFEGFYNGNGKSISKLIIKESVIEQNGLFYELDGGTVTNLALVGVEIQGTNYVGGITGTNSGTISNCSVSGTISGSIYVGGIAGNNSGTVKNCFSTVEVSIDSTSSHNVAAGGVAGYNQGELINCYSTGKVAVNISTFSEDDNAYAGGVVGENTNAVQHCYATGSVNVTLSTDKICNAYAGGVVGALTLNTNNAVDYCVALNPEITASSSGEVSIGRVIGEYPFGISLNSGYARETMRLNGTSTASLSYDGVYISSIEWDNALWWSETAKFSDNDWGLYYNRLPTLKNVPGEQNPQVEN